MTAAAFDAPGFRIAPPPAGAAEPTPTVSAPELDRSTPFTRRANPLWRRRYALELAVLDTFLAVAMSALAIMSPLAPVANSIQAGGFRVSSVVLAVALAGAWVGLLALGGVYEQRMVDVGNATYTRILNSGVRLFALLAAVAYLLELDLPRVVVIVIVPTLTVMALASHFIARTSLHRERCAGRFLEDVLVVGTPASVCALVRHLRREVQSGYRPVGVLVDTDDFFLDVDGEPIPVLGRPRWVEQALENTLADVVAVADTETLGEGALRTLAWDLEGTGVELIVAPAITEVAGPRVAVRPVAGLPLLHVEEPELGGAARLVKGVVDRVLSTLGLIALAPVFVAIAVAIKMTSPGPVFFRQTRFGRLGREFRVWKFRTMYVDAEQRLATLLEQNESSGALFKMRDDPRVTTAGRWLRRFSLDELPQLFNVFTGEMSLIGPRPLALFRPDDPNASERAVRRRHLVKPGITGLWQVSGRSDLSWEDWVRLDLYYVENWSVMLDVSILLRTAKAVITAKGAY